jgi:DNA-binding CsgD family transcriptional regulator
MMKARRKARSAAEAALPEAGPLKLADVAKRLRIVAAEAHADHFALLLSSPEPGRFLALVDSDHPGRAARASQLVEALGDRYARRAADSTRPFWWTHDEASPAAVSLAACPLAERFPTPPAALTGTAVALPLVTERDGTGLLVLCGEDMSMQPSALTELHARCLALFPAIAALRRIEPVKVAPVSKRELDCLKLTAAGQTSEEIADRLGLSAHTANRYLSNTAKKLNAVNRVHAVAKAIRLGLID